MYIHKQMPRVFPVTVRESGRGEGGGERGGRGRKRGEGGRGKEEGRGREEMEREGRCGKRKTWEG